MADLMTANEPTMVPERVMRRLFRKMQAGQALTDSEQAQLSDHSVAQKQGSDKAAEGGVDLMAELTGVPSIMRGSARIKEGAEEGDAWKTAGGAAQTAMGAVPGGMALRVGRKALATGAGALGFTGAAGLLGESYAQDEIKAEKKAGNERAGTGFFSQISDLMGGDTGSKPMDRDQFMRSRNLAQPKGESDLMAEEQAAVKTEPRYQEQGPKGRARLMEEAAQRARTRYQSEIASSGDRTKAAEGEYDKYLGDQSRLTNMSFKERAPDVAARLPIVGLMASAALPAGLSAAKNLQSWLGNSSASRFNRATKQAEDALNPGATAALSESERRAAQIRGTILDKHVAAESGMMAQAGKITSAPVTIGAGAAVGAEANMLPYQLDANKLPDYIPGPDGQPVRNPKQEQATADAFDLSKWGTKALMNLPTAVTGYKIGGMVPKQTANLPQAQGVASAIKQDLRQVMPAQTARPLPDDLMTTPPSPPQQSGQMLAVGPTSAAPGNLLPMAPGQQPQPYRSYGALPGETKQQYRDAYAATRNVHGAEWPPAASARGIQELNAKHNISVPVTPGRIKATNDAVNNFVSVNGRPPATPQEWAEIFNKKTLALPLAGAAGGGLMASGEGY